MQYLYAKFYILRNCKVLTMADPSSERAQASHPGSHALLGEPAIIR
jgi:hypothetical protein